MKFVSRDKTSPPPEPMVEVWVDVQPDGVTLKGQVRGVPPGQDLLTVTRTGVVKIHDIFGGLAEALGVSLTCQLQVKR